MEALRDLWTGARLEAVEAWEITVHRNLLGFRRLLDDQSEGPKLGPTVAAMASGDVETLKSRVRARLPQTPKDGSRTVARILLPDARFHRG
jgi:hypothetical protein